MYIYIICLFHLRCFLSKPHPSLHQINKNHVKFSDDFHLGTARSPPLQRCSWFCRSYISLPMQQPGTWIFAAKITSVIICVCPCENGYLAYTIIKGNQVSQHVWLYECIPVSFIAHTIMCYASTPMLCSTNRHATIFCLAYPVHWDPLSLV